MRKLLSILFISLCYVTLQGQSISIKDINVGSKHVKTDSINVSYSLGGLFVPTLKNANRNITQGFQQPEIKTFNVQNEKYGNLTILLYPNPARDFVSLSLSGLEKSENAKLYLYDNQGKLVKEINEKITGKNHHLTLNIEQCPQGIYNLILNINKKYIQDFKIIKINNHNNR